MNRVNLKQKAKSSLEGMYIYAIGILIIYLLIEFLASFIVIRFDSKKTILLSFVVSLIINGLFTFGYYKFSIKNFSR